MIFSEENFPSEADNNDNLTADEDEVELNIGKQVPYKCSSQEQNCCETCLLPKAVLHGFSYLSRHLYIIHIAFSLRI